MAGSIIIDVVPPAQAHQQPACDVLNCPEIQRHKEEDDNKVHNKALAVEVTEEVRD